MPYREIEYLTCGGTVFLSCLKRIPSSTISCKWRISIRSVIPGMLRPNSLVRIGPPSSLHKIVPFQRPSMTDSIESIGQAETSFLETGICLHFRTRTDKLVSTSSCITTLVQRVHKPGETDASSEYHYDYFRGLDGRQ